VRTAIDTGSATKRGDDGQSGNAGPLAECLAHERDSPPVLRERRRSVGVLAPVRQRANPAGRRIDHHDL
jgi:hypothetical protein